MWRFFQSKREEYLKKIMKPIPEEFFSFETGEPFAQCIECSADFRSQRSPYGIQKVYQDGEVLYEYALCHDCGLDLRGEISKESMRHMKRAFRGPKLKTTTDGCRACGLPKHELPSYTIVGSCMGAEMVFWNVPILICEPCIEAMSEGLSQETKDVLDDFEERNFPGPPEMELDLPQPKRRKVVLM